MTQIHTILIFICYFVITCQPQTIKQNLQVYENQYILEIQIRIQTNQEFKLTFYNGLTHTNEGQNCLNKGNCKCDSQTFSNFHCFEDQNSFLITFTKFPYFQGDNILNIEEMTNNLIDQHTKNTDNNHHLRALAVQNKESNQIAPQSVSYKDQDLSSSLQLGDYDLYLKWQIYNNGTFDMAVDYNHQNWIGLGFCPNMNNCDMIFISIANQTVMITDNFAKGQVKPIIDISNDIQVISYAINSTGYSVRFNRKLNTGDSNDEILVQGKQYQFCVAWSTENSMEGHNRQYTFDINFDNNIIGKVSLDNGMDTLYVVHAVVLFIAWGIFADIGIIIGRFFKSINSYLWIHAICFMIVDFSTIILVILVLVIGIKGGNIEEDGTQAGHNAISIFLTLLVIVEHILGIIVKHNLESNDTVNRQSVYKIRKVHVILGTLMFLAAKIDIILGFIKHESSLLLILAIIWTALLILIRVGLEIYKSKYLSIKSKIVPHQSQILNENQQKLIKLLEGNQSTNQIIKELPNIKWVMLDQDIYDLTDYQHPAGNFLISNVNGKEISRYFYGAFGLESTQVKSYNHSQVAYKSLQSRYIGRLQPKNVTHQNPGSPWELNDFIKLSNNIAQFDFTNKDFTINLNQNLQDLGQHFSISLTEVGGKIRMYTKVLCMASPYQQFRNQVIDYCEDKTSEKPVLQYQQTNTIPLIVKKYNYKNALSAKIFDHKGQFWIQGPFGRGLELQSKSKCIAFVGGTGILPFLDLLDFLLMKSYHLTNPTKQEQISSFFPQVNQLDNEFEFILLASFQNEEEFIGKEWIRKLYQINKDNKLKLFDMKIRYSDGQLDQTIPAFHNRFTEEFVKSLLVDFNKNIFICGPPNMISSLTQIISQTNQDQQKVVIV
ncbi:unnamed protein product [Paramecium pentaurelia]|uniref:DOMON domain protein n=1 Tax=Paramecium pentaurelia TaxID=43138 RepID=A0A8S1VDV4_9CILI|nr:unnamed protein product [Paramecium pentaurelia]